MSEIGPNQILFNQPNCIKSDAIALAYNILQMHNIEFTSLSLDELKNKKSNISNHSLINSALNILIFYKLEDSNGFLPKQHNQNIFIEPRIDQPSFEPFEPFTRPRIDAPSFTRQSFDQPSFDRRPSFDQSSFNQLNSFQKINRINNNIDNNTVNRNTRSLNTGSLNTGSSINESSNNELNRQFI